MKIITKVEYIDVLGYSYRLIGNSHRLIRRDLSLSEMNGQISSLFSSNERNPIGSVGCHRVRQEIIEGTVFTNAHGDDIILGASKEVQDTLGLPFIIFKNHIQEVEDLRDEIDGMQVVINHQKKVIDNLKEHIELLQNKKNPQKRDCRLIRVG